jgi:D-mannonate dehydratase
MLGSSRKISNVHFRNIKGGLLKFHEIFPYEGDVDMIRAMRVYREVDYDGMIMPDHAPRVPGDEHGRQAYAFEFGLHRRSHPTGEPAGLIPEWQRLASEVHTRVIPERTPHGIGEDRPLSQRAAG